MVVIVIMIVVIVIMIVVVVVMIIGTFALKIKAGDVEIGAINFRTAFVYQ